MNANMLRSVTAVMSLGVAALAHAQATTNYTSPAKWNNFYPTSLYAQNDTPSAAQSLPSPAADAAVDMPPAAEPIPMDASVTSVGEDVGAVGGECCQAASAPWPGTRLPLKPCFASFNLLYLTSASDCAVPIAGGLGGYTTDVVNPSFVPGFEVELGRYFCCGKFGLGVGYFFLNPESASQTRLGAAGTITPWMPAYRDVSINPGALGVDTVYNHISNNATGVRVSRDIFYQGIEANMYCFGLMGSRRVSRPCCNSACCCGLGKNCCRGCYGFSGAGGPMTRPCSGCIRVTASHGFRWFQAKDRLDFDYNIDGTRGYQADDIYECYHVENNLFGYQVGSILTYCINACWNLNVGGKFGLFGNYAQLDHQLGTFRTTAYRNGGGLVNTSDSDTSLATMGELDFGLGRRIGCAWTVRFGYRLWGINGVATAPDSITGSYASVASSGKVCANDTILLHGGYVGLDFNW